MLTTIKLLRLVRTNPISFSNWGAHAWCTCAGSAYGDTCRHSPWWTQSRFCSAADRPLRSAQQQSWPASQTSSSYTCPHRRGPAPPQTRRHRTAGKHAMVHIKLELRNHDSSLQVHVSELYSII